MHYARHLFDQHNCFTQKVHPPIPLCAMSQSFYTNYRITPSIVNTCSELRYGGSFECWCTAHQASAVQDNGDNWAAIDCI
jgi:hypothetical protein